MTAWAAFFVGGVLGLIVGHRVGWTHAMDEWKELARRSRRMWGD